MVGISGNLFVGKTVLGGLGEHKFMVDILE